MPETLHTIGTEEEDSNLPQTERGIEEVAPGTLDAQEWSSKIFFKENGKECIPFHEFLRGEKKQRGLTWEAMNTLCGTEQRVSSYALNVSEGHPNSPPLPTFQRIIQALGYSSEQFEHHDLREEDPRGSPEYKQVLRSIGEEILRINASLPPEKHPQRLSFPIIRSVGGEYFVRKHGHTITERQQMLNDLHALDPRFAGIQLQNQQQEKPYGNQPLSHLEAHLIEHTLRRYLQKQGWRGGRVPTGTYDHVYAETTSVRIQLHQYLATLRSGLGIPEPEKPRELKERTIKSVMEHMWTLLGRWKQYTFTEGSPEPNAPLSLKEQIAEEIDDLPPPPPFIEEDSEGKRKEFYLEYSPYGHQAIIAYLMEPGNFKKLLGEDAELISIDFNQEHTPPELFERHCDKLSTLAPTAEDEEVAAFVDGWMRCDMIFVRRNIGEHVVIEVKQRAMNTDRYPNAEKARQQLAAYTATLSDNIARHNQLHGTTLPTNARGVLAAFEVQDDLKAHLENHGRGVIILDREEVYSFAQGKQKPAEQEPPPPLPIQPLPQQARKRLTKEDYEQRLRTLRSIDHLLQGVPEGLNVGSCYGKNGETVLEIDASLWQPLTEFSGRLIRITLKEGQNILQGCLRRGLLRQEKVNAMKYNSDSTITL